jgi:hypothetical protein
MPLHQAEARIEFDSLEKHRARPLSWFGYEVRPNPFQRHYRRWQNWLLTSPRVGAIKSTISNGAVVSPLFTICSIHLFHDTSGRPTEQPSMAHPTLRPSQIEPRL